MMCRRSSPVASLTSRSVGPRPCSHQNANTSARTCFALSENSNSGTFCGTGPPPAADYARPGSAADDPAPAARIGERRTGGIGELHPEELVRIGDLVGTHAHLDL